MTHPSKEILYRALLKAFTLLGVRPTWDSYGYEVEGLRAEKYASPYPRPFTDSEVYVGESSSKGIHLICRFYCLSHNGTEYGETVIFVTDETIVLSALNDAVNLVSARLAAKLKSDWEEEKKKEEEEAWKWRAKNLLGIASNQAGPHDDVP